MTLTASPQQVAIFEVRPEAVNHIIHKAETNRFTLAELMGMKGVIDTLFHPVFVAKAHHEGVCRANAATLRRPL